MASYKGSSCKGDCGGHKAGYRYAMRGGRGLTFSSSSFNNGMRIAQKEMKSAGKRTRMATNRRSK